MYINFGTIVQLTRFGIKEAVFRAQLSIRLLHDVCNYGAITIILNLFEKFNNLTMLLIYKQL